jgi:hypothetical protein
MLLKLSQLRHLDQVDKIIFNSIEASLYQLSLEIDGKEYYITNDKGEMLRAFNLIKLQQMTRGLKSKKMVLRHNSPYDEMIGLDEVTQERSNTLEVTLGDNDLG